MNEAERVEIWLNDHAERIRMLEIKDATQNAKIDMLCEKLEELSMKISDWMDFMKEAFWKVIGLCGSIFMVFLGFFIWYVQKLGG